MTEAAHDDPDAPIWAREDAFPNSPSGWGWLDNKQRKHPIDSSDKLIAAIRDDRNADISLVWTPAHRHMILPEEMEGAAEAVITARKRRAADDLREAHDKLRWFGILLGGILLYIIYQAWARSQGIPPQEKPALILHTVFRSMSVGITLLMFLIFAFIPWYHTRKHLRELNRSPDSDIAAIIPVLRFETWLQRQKAPVTRVMLALVALVGLSQLTSHDSINAAGLVKSAYFQGQWWRLFTSPLMHGNLIHFLMNAAALLYLGKRMEVFARWPHVPMVFLFSACVGGEASARFLQTTSVGASGGLMGWLGFLLVFESLHGRLVPRKARRRLLAGVLLTGLIGLIGYRFIDNAAHTGGLLAGMLYAAIVFPKSSSPNRPKANLTDWIGGSIALVVLTASAAFAVLKIRGF